MEDKPMVRPRCNRRVAGAPYNCLFKPAGIPARSLAEIVLTLDELEAIRLADFEGLYQEAAANEMNISRPTFGRVIESAHKKIAQALLQGMILRIGGGVVEIQGMRTFVCFDCRHTWNEPHGKQPPAYCPACRSAKIRRIDKGKEE
jgi:predicted DNA-binding protein (UPF0251 family)